MLAAIRRRDAASCAAIVRTAACRADTRSEKVISRRHRFLFIGVPKAASQNLIAALGAADSDARVIRQRTLAQILAAHPEIRDYYSFAFLRHPLHRAFSFYAYIVRERQQGFLQSLNFIGHYHGLHPEMTFGQFCRWLNTPYGSDAFADRHWLSQHRHVQFPDGRAPDFIGRYEHLDADWQRVLAHLDMPPVPLPRHGKPGNAKPASMVVEEHLEDDTAQQLHRRYAKDFQLGGYASEHAAG